MLSMGLTLTVDNFKEVGPLHCLLLPRCCAAAGNAGLLQCLARPKPIIVGFLAQYLVKPILGFVIAKAQPRLGCSALAAASGTPPAASRPQCRRSWTCPPRWRRASSWCPAARAGRWVSAAARPPRARIGLSVGADARCAPAGVERGDVRALAHAAPTHSAQTSCISQLCACRYIVRGPNNLVCCLRCCLFAS